MTPSNNRLNRLTEALDIYSDCWTCGTITSDPSLLKPDPINPGQFRAQCPSCNREQRRFRFPMPEIRPVFEMIVECAQLKRPILVLTLACTIYEAMVDGFVYRLLERQNCPPDVCEAFIDSIQYPGKVKLMEYITNKKLKTLAKEMGFKEYFSTLDKIKKKRNTFLHTGMAHKTVDKEIGTFSFPTRVQLDENDMNDAVDFAHDTIPFFAKLYTKYGKWEPLFEDDWN